MQYAIGRAIAGRQWSGIPEFRAKRNLAEDRIEGWRSGMEATP
jgi:hypothetical protein